MDIKRNITLDLLDTRKPALSATSDMPVIETKPDSTPAPKTEAKAETKVVAKEDAAPDKKGEKPAESAPAEKEAAGAAKPEDSSASDGTDVELDAEANVRAEQKEPSKKSKGVQKRIDELTRQREDERRAREATEARLDRALGAIERLTGKPAAEAKQELAEEDPEPMRPVKAQFPDEVAYEQARDDYTEKKASWIARREIKATIAERERKAAEDRAQEENARVQTTYKERVEKAVEKYEDYLDVAESPDVAITIPMAQAIMASDFGPDLQYHLGKNPAEAERISKLSVPGQLLALGRIEASIASKAEKPVEKPVEKTDAKTEAEPAAPAAKQVAVSSAPPPVKTVKAGNAKAQKDIYEMSMDEYAAHRKAQLAAERRPGARH